jgi:hypothetical protein
MNRARDYNDGSSWWLAGAWVAAILPRAYKHKTSSYGQAQNSHDNLNITFDR